MIYFIVNEGLSILHRYEAEEITELWDCKGTHLPLPENLDPDCIKAVLVDDVITLVEDGEKVAAKALAAKEVQISALKAQCDADIEVQQVIVYGTKNQSAALATQQSWSDIEANTAQYVPLMFPTIEDAQAYIAPKMLAARQFAAWRFARIMQRDADIAAL